MKVLRDAVTTSALCHDLDLSSDHHTVLNSHMPDSVSKFLDKKNDETVKTEQRKRLRAISRHGSRIGSDDGFIDPFVYRNAFSLIRMTTSYTTTTTSRVPDTDHYLEMQATFEFTLSVSLSGPNGPHVWLPRRTVYGRALFVG